MIGKFFSLTLLGLAIMANANAEFSTNKVKIKVDLKASPLTAAAIGKESKAKISVGEIVGGKHTGEIDIAVSAKSSPMTAIAVGAKAEAEIKVGSLREK
jgi:hypothetical protein